MDRAGARQGPGTGSAAAGVVSGLRRRVDRPATQAAHHRQCADDDPRPRLERGHSLSGSRKQRDPDGEGAGPLPLYLSRPFIADPGTRWIYGAASTALIGKLIQDGTRQSLPDFAREALFAPFGAGPIEWSNGFNGEPSPNSGLRMTPRDLARIGKLILDRGRWDGERSYPHNGWSGRSSHMWFATSFGDMAISGMSVARNTAARRSCHLALGRCLRLWRTAAICAA